ncbi:hypothetical protein MSI_06280 [Treponema sp. JC4]|uniref:hypothetical protein n=1 Tax=Treponema sp. JC4 TaxID=1124982 RepID=UPI00025AFB7C|nr:hypothetical protein [Treponema sp. JC4]EID85809.1 hypothetical protein MSI_06280 [Treponema sp. JC4]
MTKTEIEKYFTTETREFNPVVFAHLFTKVRTIGFSTNSLSNKEFLQYRELLIIELNYYDKAIALDFARVLSNQSLQTYSKEFYNLVYIMFSHFVEIYNNLHQYKEATINTNIRIAKTYLEEAQKKLNDTELKKALQNIYDFLKLVYDEYKEELKATSLL